jgi:phosphatidate cytidylyltransferase
VTDRKDSDQAAATPAEGVRILGAEEAKAALGEPVVQDDGIDLTDDAAPHRDVGFPEEGPSWSAAAAGESSVETPAGEVPPLPHWTEAPTGAVPAIFADDSAEHAAIDDDLEAWASISGSQPRFRAEDADWAEEDALGDLSGEQERLGALDEAGPVDEEAEFEEALAARRRPARTRKAAVPAAAAAGARKRPESEPASPAPAAPRDLPTAIMTAAAVVIVALVCFRAGPNATVVLAALIIGVATAELCNTLQTKGMRPATVLAILGGLTLPIAAKHYGAGAYPVYFALIVVFSMLWFLWRVTPGRPLLGVATTVLAFAYVGGLGGFAGLLLAAPHDNGIGLVIGVTICVVAYDVIGFFVGSQFGQSRIAPNVSPNKTVAGTVGGMGASVAFGLLAAGSIGPWDYKSGLALGILVAVGAFLGDLCESMIKRDLGVKDFGTILPGHGGVLDRFDALLFCLPIAYYLALNLKIL